MTPGPPSPGGRLTLVLGGARSGKSTFAERCARTAGGPVVYVATATAGDDEMATRIADHRSSRPADWVTVEEPLDVDEPLRRWAGRGRTIVLDCLTLLVSNLIQTPGGPAFDEKLARVVSAAAEARDAGSTVVVVSNEVGLGLVPPYPLGRRFRDALGRANQAMADVADDVYLLVAGRPVTVRAYRPLGPVAGGREDPGLAPRGRVNPLRQLAEAFGLLTVLPLPRACLATRSGDPDLAGCAAYFPLVGLALGAGLGGLDLLVSTGLSLPVRSALLLAASWLATGGLHLDGLADTCDGLLSRVDRQRALDIMRDPRLGSFGAAGLILALVLKFALLSTLSGPGRMAALVLTPVAGRQAVVLAMALYPAARLEGLGWAFARRVGPGGVLASLALSTVGLGVAVAAGGPATTLAPALAGSLAVGLALGGLASRKLAGVTGDVYGALSETGELAFLLLAGWL